MSHGTISIPEPVAYGKVTIVTFFCGGRCGAGVGPERGVQSRSAVTGARLPERGGLVTGARCLGGRSAVSRSAVGRLVEGFPPVSNLDLAYDMRYTI